MADEFQQRFAGRYFGKYRGIVLRSSDPRGLGRLMLRVPIVLGDEELGWAWPAPPTGGGENTGDFSEPEIGDFVWVEFEEGDPTRPIWRHGPWGIRDGQSMMPKHSRGSMDATDLLNRDYGIAPPSQYLGTYGNVRAIQGKGASFLEFDDTNGMERVQLAHRTGTRIEMTLDGGMQEIATAGVVRRAGGMHRVEIEGGEEYSVGGVSSRRFERDLTEFYGGVTSKTYRDMNQTGKTFVESWDDIVTSSLGGYGLSVNAQGLMQFGGGLSLMVGQNMACTVLDTLEIGASNATGLPTANAITVHGYNGKVLLKSTDVTGLVEEASVTLDGTPVIGKASIAGGKLGGQIDVLNLPVANILLGGVSAVNPVVLGPILVTILTQILTELATHVHATAGVGPPVPSVSGPVLASSVIPTLPTMLSQFVLTS